MALRHLFRRQGWTLWGGGLVLMLVIGGVWGRCAPSAQAFDLAQEPTATLPPRHTPTPEPTTPTIAPPTPTSPPPTDEPEPPEPPPPSEPSAPTVTPTCVLLPNSGQAQSGAASEGVIIGALLLAGAVILGAYVARKGVGNGT